MKADLLVLGAGVAGMKVSLEAASRGLEVVVVEGSPFVGGEITYLERQFPTDRCLLCQMLPTTVRRGEGEYCLRRSFRYPGVVLFTRSELVKLEGQEGDFKALVKRVPRGVKEERCISCLKCIEVCPREARDDFNPFASRKAMFLKGPEPIPPVPAVDWSLCDRCGNCAEVCPTKAVDLWGEGEELELSVGSVVLATGFVPYDPTALTQYGYQRFKNVLTAFDFERMLSPLGPFLPFRPSDGEVPRKLGFLLCVGSRDKDWEPCSGSCCMIALKQARLTKERLPEAEVVLFYMDIRTYGKGYHVYLEEAKKRGIKFIRGRVPKLWEDPVSKRVLLRYMEAEEVKEEAFDLVVLVTGQRPPEGFEGLSRVLGLECDPWGFIKAEGVKTSRGGIYVCGSASGPKDIVDTVTEALAVASEVSKGKRGKGERRAPLPEPSKGLDLILCSCGGELPVDVFLEEFKGKFDRVTVKEYLCLEGGEGLGDRRTVIGACSPYWYKEKVRSSLGLPPSRLEWVNLKAAFTAQGREAVLGLLLGARERLIRSKEVVRFEDGPVPSAVVLGGGLCGLNVALGLAREGLMVHLIEKEGELGGVMREYVSLREELLGLLKELEGVQGVEVYLKSRLKKVVGVGGRFKVEIEKANGEVKDLEVGVIVVAIGSKRVLPEGFSSLKGQRVVSQRELWNDLMVGRQPEGTVLMLLCGGTRTGERPWCNRYCCEEALSNALALRQKGVEVFILFKDMMSYGLKESLYFEARRKGVVFLRYEEEPEVEVSDKVRVRLKGVELEGDLLVIPEVEVPREDNWELAGVLGVDLDLQGFFKEAEPKFRPVDALKEGIYICGGCHSPRSFEEAKVQAKAVVQRVMAFMSQRAQGFPLSYVEERRCSGCGLCVKACPYGARYLEEGEKVAKVIASICQGCGTCCSLCPNGASKLEGAREEQVLSAIEAMVGR